MLTSLYIRNFALIEDIHIGFTAGLTVMTGETGAGKSIVVDALSLVLGGRADTTMVRQGSSRAVIEAGFDAVQLEEVRELVERLGAEWQPLLILRREISIKGNSRAFINDSPVPIAELRGLGDRLVDIHGQHEHQSLLRCETHRAILDSDNAVAAALTEYQNEYRQLIAVDTELTEAVKAREKINERRLLARHQLQEIDAISPEPGEEDEIEKELRVVEHAEKLAVSANEVIELLYDGEHNIADMLGRITRVMDDIIRIDAGLQPLQQDVGNMGSGINEIARSLRDYIEGIDFTPGRAEQLRHRLADILQLVRRYRMTTTELLDFRERLQQELAGLENIDERIADLEKKMEEIRARCSMLADKLSSIRKKTGIHLGKSVVNELKNLGISHAVFETRLIPNGKVSAAESRYLLNDGIRVACNEYGWEEVEFFLSTNVGEEVKPLARVVSGGEVSRIMLALKTIFAGRERVPIMVFDEIDTGVSGTIARKIGLSMRKLAAKHQLLAITHLPQIAGVGHAHLRVEKTAADGRTTTRVVALAGEERITEVARLLSGDSVTPAAMASAVELMQDRE